MRVRIAVDFNIDDTKASVTQLISRLGPLLADDPPEEWTIDMAGCHYLGPDAAVIIWSTVKLARSEGHSATVFLPTEPLQLHGFCRYSGLRHLILGEEAPDPDHPDNETIPIEEFEAATWNRPDAIVKLISRHTELDRDTEDYLRNCVAEAAQNIEDHADSPIGGISCARYLQNRNEVRIALIDRGEGIWNTLKRQYPDIPNAATALQMVLKGDHSSKSRETNAGMGISLLASIVQHLKGRLLIISQNAIADTSGGNKPNVEVREWNFPGTCIFFTLPVAQTGQDT